MNKDNIVNIDHEKCLELSVQLFSAWLTNNRCELDDVSQSLAKFYNAVYKQKKVIKGGSETGFGGIEAKDTVFRDYIICLEDGVRLKTLKRHLSAKYNMSIEEYKTKWGLPSDYPTVAPSYTDKRSYIAKNFRGKKKEKNDN